MVVAVEIGIEAGEGEETMIENGSLMLFDGSPFQRDKISGDYEIVFRNADANQLIADAFDFCREMKKSRGVRVPVMDSCARLAAMACLVKQRSNGRIGNLGVFDEKTRKWTLDDSFGSNIENGKPPHNLDFLGMSVVVPDGIDEDGVETFETGCIVPIGENAVGVYFDAVRPELAGEPVILEGAEGYKAGDPWFMRLLVPLEEFAKYQKSKQKPM